MDYELNPTVTFDLDLIHSKFHDWEFVFNYILKIELKYSKKNYWYLKLLPKFLRLDHKSAALAIMAVLSTCSYIANFKVLNSGCYYFYIKNELVEVNASITKLSDQQIYFYHKEKIHNLHQEKFDSIPKIDLTITILKHNDKFITTDDFNNTMTAFKILFWIYPLFAFSVILSIVELKRLKHKRDWKRPKKKMKKKKKRDKKWDD